MRRPENGRDVGGVRGGAMRAARKLKENERDGITSQAAPATGDKASTGVSGLDHLLRGGLPAHRIHLVEGHPGSGKTTLGLQFLLEGVRHGESCMYITLSETAEELRANAAAHGWDLSCIHIHELQPAENLRPEEQYTLFHPSEIELGDLSRNVFEVVEQFKPARAVLDSVSDMRLLARDSLRYRRQVLGLKQFFVGRGCTLMLLNETGVSDTDAHIQSLAQGVIRLEQSVLDFGIARRRLEIVKLRGVAYVGGYHDFRIETGGMRVFPRLENRRFRRPPPKETLKSGLPHVDSLLGDGVPMGTCTLILGPSGVGKSTLSAQYLSCAAAKGIHGAAFLFDEQRQIFLERGDALGMRLSKYAKSDALKIAKVEPGSMSPGEFSHSVRKAVEDDKVRVVLIDSLTGYLTAIPEAAAAVVRLHELTSYLASCGVATFLTVAQQGMLGQNMASPVDVSYIADTMFMMRFFEAGGHVHKAVSVLKKRTGLHETTIREIGIRNNALWVGEPLRNFRGVLTGVPEYRETSLDDKLRVGKKA
jgi:circadian clock protein KaiC